MFLDPVRSAFAIGGVTLTEDTMTGVAIFPTYRINIGGDYNTSTGQFTCEIPGTYVFSFNLVKTSAATSSVYCYFRKNGGYQGYAAVPATTGFHESSVSLILSLGENDTVDVGDCGNVDDISSVTSFTGFLLYPV